MIKAMLLTLVLASQCTPSPKPSPDPVPTTTTTVVIPPPIVDGGTEPVTDCEKACAVFAKYKCKEALPTPKGTTCVEVCKNAEDSEVLSLNPDCVKHADSCESAKACRYAGVKP